MSTVAAVRTEPDAKAEAEAGFEAELATAASSTKPQPRRGLAARLLIGLVRIYQAVRRGRPSPCRYLPSCSEYAAIALDRHGATRGGWLAVRRLCRCHPWGGFGSDPVPERPGVRNLS